MSFYSKGNAHKIAAMASKSCNAVSARDLYVPITVEDPVITSDAQGYRHYSLTVKATCYFGTRIGIENTFMNMTLGGQSVPNKLVDAYVKGTEPGYQIATITITGDYSDEGIADNPIINVTFSGEMDYYSDVGCTKHKTIPFFNEVEVVMPTIEPYYTAPDAPTIESVTSLDSGFYVNVATTSYGRGGGAIMYVEASKTSDFANVKTSTVINSLTGTVLLSNLQKNTNYYLRVKAANNGLSTTGEVEEHVTLASSQIMRTFQQYYTGSGNPIETVVGLTFLGGQARGVNVTIQYSENGTTWNTAATTFEGVPQWQKNTINNSGTVPKRVYFRVKTETSGAGVHYSEPVIADIPAKNSVCGYMDSVVLNGNQITFTYHTNGKKPEGGTSNEHTLSTFYIRQAGYEGEWIELGTADDWGVLGYTRTKTFTINDVLNNYVEYEAVIDIVGVTSGEEFTTTTWSLFSIPTQVHNDTCDSLDYLVQLICQSLNAIRQGNITVYMNDDTKKWCEGEDGVPTLASIMSRVNRYMHTVGCILCSMEGFLELMKDADTNQVFMGQLGWVDIDEEPLDGSMNPVFSGGVYDAVEDVIRQVWHYAGEYDYFAYNPLELNAQSGTAVNQTAVMGNKKYKWNGSSWVEDGEPVMENFGVIHINAGRHADEAFYWFVDDWNRLDADTTEIEARLDALESLAVVHSYDNQDYLINVQSFGLTDAQYAANVPTDSTRETIILLTEAANTGLDVDVIVAESSGNYNLGGN